ncbi:unnamed protein product [Heligmosomoides polygyrus]|uniref:Transmembrane protein n=1 Tax=Heligmosomoides polygyrus TaxID=6339 RepID=A0A3P8B5D5_HELPZ|nr:unnamed protein product [Heligmosomoides polygyrus]
MSSAEPPENKDDGGIDAFDDEGYDEDEEEPIQNIYLHICNEEGREFAGVTTFHGMACEKMQVVEWSLRRSDCVPAMLNRPEWVPECVDQTIPLDGSLKREFPCHPPCSSLEWRSTMSDLRTSKGFKISVEFSRRKEVLVEVRKMGITDVLSFIGGGTSLFLGCSCVTLMETFIFLLKLVLQSVNKESYDGIGTESAYRSDSSLVSTVSEPRMTKETVNESLENQNRKDSSY